MLSQNRQLILCAWSSSEYSSNNAWEVNANNGNVNNNNKNNNKYVRCVLAFWDKTNMSVFILPELAGLRSGRVSIFYFQKGCRQPGEETRPGVKQKNGQLILCAWSSSEYTNTYAWGVGARNGSVAWSHKGSYYGYVRCVLAFWDKTNMSVFILPELAGLRSGRVSIFYFQKGCRQPGEETRPGVKSKQAADIVRLVFVRV